MDDQLEDIRLDIKMLDAKIGRKFSLQDDHYRRLSASIARLDGKLNRVIAIVDGFLAEQMRERP